MYTFVTKTADEIVHEGKLNKKWDKERGTDGFSRVEWLKWVQSEEGKNLFRTPQEWIDKWK